MIDNEKVGFIPIIRKPQVNIVSREEFLKRTEIIFDIYEEILVKTLGPYGSPTIISSFPMKLFTKDGYTVARNIEFDIRNGEKIDQTISLLILDICTRLNNTVGDGTTTAIVSTNQLYKEVYKLISDIHSSLYGIRSRDLINLFNEIRDEIIDRLKREVKQITSENMKEIIKDIVYVSSNQDEKITKMVSDAYDVLGYPSIVCTDSDNNESYCEIIDGFQAKVFLGDKVYINTDDMTANAKRVDVIMFGKKVSAETYVKIIRPLTMHIRNLGRHLICIAPSYDDTLRTGMIKRELMQEFEATNDITLVLSAIQLSNDEDRLAYEDLALVLNTMIIDRNTENEIIDKLENMEGGADITKLINFSDRGIPGITVYNNDGFEKITAYAGGVYNPKRKESYIIDLGYAEEVSLGLKKSTFRNGYYNQEKYKKTLEIAKQDLNEVIRKYALLGTYSKDIYEKQKRYSTLNMKMAKIYAGGETIEMRGMVKDSIEDSIRAAESAYRYGYIQGCGVSMIRCISDLIEESDNTSKIEILKSLREAYVSVYRLVLLNAFGDEKLDESSAYERLKEFDFTEYEIESCIKSIHTGEDFLLVDVIIFNSIIKNQVFDINSMRFTDKVINSVNTDIEILKANSDLLSMLMTGNQVVLASYDRM